MGIAFGRRICITITINQPTDIWHAYIPKSAKDKNRLLKEGENVDDSVS